MPCGKNHLYEQHKRRQAPSNSGLCFCRDAEDAVRGRDGKELMGMRMRVEIARGRNDRRREPGDRRERFRAPGTGFRVVVKGLPPSAAWQDLKDYFRRVAPPAFTDVIRGRDGATGIVEFESGADMDRAIRQLDDTEFKNPFDSGVIRVMEDRDGPRGPPSGRGPPRGRYRSRSPPGRRYSRSPPRRRDSRSPPPRRYSRSPSPPRGGSSRSPPRRGDSRSPPRDRSVSRSPPSRGRSVSRSPPRGDDRFEMDDGRD